MHAAELVLWPFLEEAPFASAMFDLEMRYLHATRGWRKDYGLGQCELRGVSHYEVFPEIPERWKSLHRRALAGEFQQCEEDRFERADGTVQWLRRQIRPWYESDKAIGGIVISTEDITARKGIEEQRGQEHHKRSQKDDGRFDELALAGKCARAGEFSGAFRHIDKRHRVGRADLGVGATSCQPRKE